MKGWNPDAPPGRRQAILLLLLSCIPGHGMLLLAALTAVLTACQAPSTPPEGDDTPPGLVRDDSLGFSLMAPAGWSGFSPGSPPLRMTFMRDAFRDFQATVSMVAGPDPSGIPMPEILKSMSEAKFQEYGSEFHVLTEDTSSLGGRPAGLLAYTFVRNGMTLQSEQIVLRHRQSLLILTCMEKAGDFPARAGEFRAIRESLAFHP